MAVRWQTGVRKVAGRWQEDWMKEAEMCQNRGNKMAGKR